MQRKNTDAFECKNRTPLNISMMHKFKSSLKADKTQWIQEQIKLNWRLDKGMGRTFKGVIDQAKALDKEGYTQKEIAEKLNISQGTVRKYLGEKAVDGCEREVSVLFEAFFGLLTDLETSTLVGPENLDSLAWSRGLEVARRLFKLNKRFAQKILSSYLKHLRDMQILDLAINDHELSEEDLQLRNQWLGLLKTEYPEKLAEFV